MPRKATGSIRWRNGVAYARITLGPNNRPGIALRTCRTQPEAEARQQLLAGLAEKLRAAGHIDLALEFLKRAATRDGKALEDVCAAVDRLCAGQPVRVGLGDAPETFQTFGQKWTKGELHQLYPDHVRAKRSVEDDKLRLNKLYDVIGEVALAKFTLDDAERAMRALPEGLSPGSRRKYGQLINRVLAMAVYPARIIAVNPLPRGFLPKPGKPKAYPILYPDEDKKLLACADLPIHMRVLYGFLHRGGCRRSEALGLRIKDFDLERGTVLLSENKTEDPRMWALSPGVASAIKLYLETFRESAEATDHVFADENGVPINDDHMADHVREDLEQAKVTRSELLHASAKRGRFETHGFRRSFVTLNLALANRNRGSATERGIARVRWSRATSRQRGPSPS
jgi:integrase